MEVGMDSPNKLQKYKSKKVHKYKSTHNSVIFKATDSRSKFICTIKPNEKVQKYKSTKIQKYKIEKYKNMGKL